MEASKANPEEVELLISTESIEKADAIIAPKDISRGVKKRSNHYATKAQFSHLIEGCRYKRTCIPAENMLKRTGIDGSGVRSVAMNRVGDKQKSFFKKSGTDEEHNLIHQNTPITSININFFVRSFVHLGYAREDDIRCIVCKIDGIESKSTRHHQVFKELLECSARKKFIFIPLYYGKGQTSHTTGITVDIMKKTIFSFNRRRQYGHETRRKTEREFF